MSGSSKDEPEALVVSMRRRPVMYLGNAGAGGLQAMIEEALGHVLFYAEERRVSTIEVVLYEDGSSSVSADSPGLPVQSDLEGGPPPATRAFLERDGWRSLYSHSPFGISMAARPGLPVLNALSAWLEVSFTQGGRGYRQRFERGTPVTPLEESGSGPRGPQGLTLHWLPDPQIFGEAVCSRRSLAERLRVLSYLLRGTRLALCVRPTGERIEYYSEEGLAEYVRLLNTGCRGRHPVVTAPHRGEYLSLDLAFQYAEGSGYRTVGFGNYHPTPYGGPFVKGLLRALAGELSVIHSQRFRESSEQLDFEADDVLPGLTAVVSVLLPEPMFGGATRGWLQNPELEPVVAETARAAVKAAAEQHPQLWWWLALDAGTTRWKRSKN